VQGGCAREPAVLRTLQVLSRGLSSARSPSGKARRSSVVTSQDTGPGRGRHSPPLARQRPLSSRRIRHRPHALATPRHSTG
jgi:hypothetical protein